MIISQTPYRVSFAGGGTDLPAFYRSEYGAVLSTTIDQHMYVTIHRRFESSIRVGYSTTETADSVDAVRHDLVREAMKLVEIDEPLEITTIGDVPAGTGMGSSSSLATGLLNALYAYRGQVVGHEKLAQQACKIEIEILKKPIGRQGPVRGGLRRPELLPVQPPRRHRQRRAGAVQARDARRAGAVGRSCSTPARPAAPTRSSRSSRAGRPTR